MQSGFVYLLGLRDGVDASVQGCGLLPDGRDQVANDQDQSYALKRWNNDHFGEFGVLDRPLDYVVTANKNVLQPMDFI